MINTIRQLLKNVFGVNFLWNWDIEIVNIDIHIESPEISINRKSKSISFQISFNLQVVYFELEAFVNEIIRESQNCSKKIFKFIHNSSCPLDSVFGSS